jgi:hypothetical protein
MRRQQQLLQFAVSRREEGNAASSADCMSSAMAASMQLDGKQQYARK